MQESWTSRAKPWAAAVLSAGLLELPFPLAGPMPPWRGVFAWFGLMPLLWALLSHPSDKNRDVASVHPTDEDLSAGAPRVGHPSDADERHPLRRRFLIGYLCGFLWYMGNCYWVRDTMARYGDMPLFAPTLLLIGFSAVLGLYFGLFGLGLAFVQLRTGSTRIALAFAPFLWTGLELAAARITSVPWDQLGYSQVDNPAMTWLAPLTGVYGITFVLVAVNSFLAIPLVSQQVLTFRSTRRWRWGAVAGIAGYAVLYAVHSAQINISSKGPTAATAVLIQPNLDVGDANNWKGAEWDRHIAEFAHLAGEECKSYLAGIPQTDAATVDPQCPAVLPHPDLVVWPESPAPFDESDPRFKTALVGIAKTVQAPLVVQNIGWTFDASAREWDYYNSAIIVDANGNRVGRYDKIHLVPFGEYIPFQKLLTFAHKLTGRVSTFTRGTERDSFLLATQDQGSHRYGVFICYEAVFADEVREFARNGAEVFVNVSDDAWYGDTSAPWQHLNMARMRAIENRRWLLRDTNSGVTAAIDPYGRVRQSIPRHQTDALPAEFGFRNDITFYTAHGDLFAWLCAVLSLGFVFWAGGRTSRRPVGIWKDRIDLEDSESFIRNLRNDDRQGRL